MGTGKTALCIALILATRGQLASVGLDDATVMTDLARSFPFANYRSSCALLSDPSSSSSSRRSRRRSPDPPVDAMVPTLVDLAINKIRISSAAISYSKDKNRLPPHIFDKIESSLPYYLPYTPSTGYSARTSRAPSKSQRPPSRIYVSSSTLIIVPNSLMFQWQGEFKKHCDLQGQRGHPIRVLYLDSDEKHTCVPQELILFDAVVVNVTRFMKEAQESGRVTISAISRTVCSSNSSHLTDNSYLVGVHWRRIIVDEGHVVGRQNQVVEMCSKVIYILQPCHSCPF